MASPANSQVSLGYEPKGRSGQRRGPRPLRSWGCAGFSSCSSRAASESSWQWSELGNREKKTHKTKIPVSGLVFILRLTCAEATSPTMDPDVWKLCKYIGCKNILGVWHRVGAMACSVSILENICSCRSINLSVAIDVLLHIAFWLEINHLCSWSRLR